MRFGFILIFIFLTHFTFGQVEKKILSVSEMKADLDSLLHTIAIAHPDPTAYCGTELWKEAQAVAYNQVQSPMTTVGFSWVVSQLLRTLNDSHTQISYGALWRQHLTNGGNVLPIRKRGSLVVKGPKAGLSPGDELISIEGWTLAQIDDMALAYSAREGDSPISEKRMQDALFSLTIAQFVIQDKDSVGIVYRDSAGETRSIRCKTMNNKDWKRYLKELNRVKEMPNFKMEDGVGFLQIPSFAPDDFAQQHRVIRRAFRKMHHQHSDTLVIDLRNNAGGLSTEVEYLYSFLSPDGCNTPHNIISKASKIGRQRYRILNRKFVQKVILKTMKKQENIYQYVYLRSQPLGHQDTVYFHQALIQPRHLYNGKVILWVNGLSASASVDFTHAIRLNHRGEIWGEPVMGGMKGTFGNTSTYTIPNSKLIAQISTIRYNYDASWQYDTQPIAPDVWIDWTPDEIRNGIDPYPTFLKKKK
jgi:C-terminal processing protease CtpA/Prc